MRRITLSVVASLATLAIAPASVLAKHHGKRHHSRSHHARVHRARVRHERFGTITAPSGTSSTTSPTTPAAASAGTVDSFDGTTLVIRLANNTLVSGTVGPNTELDCEAANMDESTAVTRMHADGDHGGGGDQGTSDNGDDTGGGDQGDQGDENGAANASCTTAGLVPGATVAGAELSISSAGATWDKVELG